MEASIHTQCLFPNIRKAFFERSTWLDDMSGGRNEPDASASGTEDQQPSGKAPMKLDLRSLSRSDGPPSELQARREKYAFFEKQCSEVAEGLFLGSDVVARNREVLRAAGITHVINCVGFLYPPYFQDELTYLVLYLQDTPLEDIGSVLYDVFDFIEAAKARDGRVLLHCSQGVSRSASLAIAYLMWKQNSTFDSTLAAVKAIRGVANPNIGFTCQLLAWQRKRAQAGRCRALYRIAPQCSAAPRHLVAKSIKDASVAALDPRGAFIVQQDACLLVWKGRVCHAKIAEAAEKAAGQIRRYEGATEAPVCIIEGEEHPALSWLAPACSWKWSKPAAEVEAYNNDFQVFAEAEGDSPPDSGRASSRSNADSACMSHSSRQDSTQAGSRSGDAGQAPDTARTNESSGRAPKTPRTPADDDVGSPNQRLRKMRRADSGPDSRNSSFTGSQ